MYEYMYLFGCLTYCAERLKRALDLAKYSKERVTLKGSPGVKENSNCQDTWSIVRRIVGL